MNTCMCIGNSCNPSSYLFGCVLQRCQIGKTSALQHVVLRFDVLAPKFSFESAAGTGSDAEATGVPNSGYRTGQGNSERKKVSKCRQKSFNTTGADDINKFESKKLNSATPNLCNLIGHVH